VPLPLGGERDGTWQIEVERAGGGDPEFPPPAVDVTYFLASVVAGGAALTPVDVPPRLYTGDVVNPKVSLRQSDGTRPEAEIILDISRPTVGTGNLLTESGLQVPTNVDGDLLNARTTTLLSLEAAAPDDLVPTTSQTFPLYDDGAHDDGAMEPDGIYGNPLSDLTRHEGTYTFHARATYGGVACVASRETMWSIRVEVAIDPDRTGFTTEAVGRLPDGRRRVRVIITPQDRYGNHLGPGEVEAFTVAGQPGSEPTGPIRDRGDGSYEVEVAWDPESGRPPSILVSQPDRSPVPVSEEPPGTTERGLPWKLLALLLFVAVIVLLLGLIRAVRRIRKLQHRVRQTWYPWARRRRS
jgi:hypothetical protein